MFIGAAISLVIGGGGGDQERGRDRVSWAGGRLGNLFIGWPMSQGLGVGGDEREASQALLLSLCRLGTICLFFGKQQRGKSVFQDHMPILYWKSLQNSGDGWPGRGRFWEENSNDPGYNSIPPKPISNFPWWNLYCGVKSLTLSPLLSLYTHTYTYIIYIMQIYIVFSMCAYIERVSLN